MKINERGMSLIELLIAFALFAIVMSGMATMASFQNKETRAMQENLQKLDAERLLNTILMRYNVCRQEVKGKVFNAASKPMQDIELEQIRYVENPDPQTPALFRKKEPLSSAPGSLQVDSIFIKRIALLPTAMNPKDRFLGELTVSFKRDNLVRSVKPIVMKVILETDPSTPENKKVITDCIVNDGGQDSCNVGNKGRLRYQVDQQEIEYCDGIEWKEYN